jgi:hypothetical protein
MVKYVWRIFDNAQRLSMRLSLNNSAKRFVPSQNWIHDNVDVVDAAVDMKRLCFEEL